MRNPLILCAALVWLIASCATNTSETTAPGEKTTERASRLPKATGTCLLVRTITGFRSLDRRRIVVEANKPYLIEFAMDCYGLTHAETIGYASRDEQICDYRSDAILVEGERCPIGSIRPYADVIDKEMEERIEEELR
jgi:hypothetical protein